MKSLRYLRLLQAFLCLMCLTIVVDSSTCIAQSPWTQIADMPVAKHGHSACFLDGKLYVMGGIDHYSNEVGEFALRDLHVYDTVLDSWTEKADMLTGRFNFSTCKNDGKILAIGGSQDIYWTPVSAIDAYDPLSDEWSTITHIPVPGVWGAAALLNDRIYVFGGAATESDLPYAKVQIYDLLADTWSEGAEMLTPRIGHKAVALNGKIYVLGGQDNSAGHIGMRTLEVFEPEANTWTKKTDMIVLRKNALSCELNGEIYVFGGMSGGNGGFREGGEIYDPLTDSWKELRDSPRALGFCAGSPMNGKVYIGGGHEGTISGLIEYRSWYIYDPQYEEIVSIPDTAFLYALIDEGVDTNGDSLISYAEAEVVTQLDVSEFEENPGNISDMTGIESFVNLEEFRCGNNELSSLDVSNNTALVGLFCYGNSLTTLDVSSNPDLNFLSCYSNLLTNLDLSNSYKLIRLSCQTNMISQIDVSNCKLLNSFNCSENLLTSLDVSYNSELGSTIFGMGSGFRICRMPSLYEVCVWEAFNVDSVSIDTTSSPNICFETDCNGECENTYIEKPQTSRFRLFPNPCHSNFTIETDRLDLYSVSINSLNGKQLKEELMNGTTHQIDISSFQNGVYFITIRSKDFVTTKKIIKY